MKKSYKIEVDCANCANKMMLKMSGEFEEGQNPKEVMKEVLKHCKKVEDDCEIYL